MNNKCIKYGLFDAAIMPQVWFNLDSWELKYEPLYRGDHQQIAEAIPYLIELDSTCDMQAVLDLLTLDNYQSGLLIESSDSLSDIVSRLAYFYHVRNEQGEPFLRRFFDLKFFNNFLYNLTSQNLQFLFGKDLVFYYLDKDKAFYHKISLPAKELRFERVDLNHFIKR
ncbi:DUF4123 domain-containing protein [Rodentibacter pneumotropicus]|uniref:DUF4123 domain-containing protein n=1 Tax=Rodentibacter pneumotropicus TaxID=758 RepID=UPI0009878771|nr:DUF4123 domain-containing protein [Rodentibacter pneumotropicus]